MTSPAIAPPVDLGDRTTYIGASEAAAILGLSKFEDATPYVKWEEKLGMRPPFKGNNYTRRGIALEPHIALGYERRHNVNLVLAGELVHPKYPFIRAHLDRFVEGHPELFVEIKTASRSADWGEPETDAVPEDHHYQIAVQFACYLPGQRCDVPADIGGPEDVEYHVVRNDTLSGNVVEGLAEFWLKNVTERIPPDPVTEADCKRRWAANKGKVFHATAFASSLISKLARHREERSIADKRVKETELDLRKLLKDADTVVDENGIELATFKEQQRSAYEVKASSFRVLRIKGGE